MVRRARGERGYILLAVFVALVVVTYAVVNSALVASTGVLNARRARERALVRQAADEVVHGRAPAGTGGSLDPAAPAEGWSDVVYADAQSGRFTRLAAGERPPEGAMVVLRLWRVTAPAGAPRRIACRAVLLDPTALEPYGRNGAERYCSADLE